MSGAQFSIKYYAGTYTTTSSLPSKATRSWVYKTNEGGYLNLHYESLKVSGDALYYDKDGVVQVPAGTLVITETKAPTGYSINTTTYIAVLKIDSNGNKTWTMYSQAAGSSTSKKITDTNIVVGQTATDTNIQIAEAPLRANITFTKTDPKYGKVMAGVEFELIMLNTDGTETTDSAFRATIKTGSDGVYRSATDSSLWIGNETKLSSSQGKLPVGKYVLKEKRCAANEGYELADPIYFEIKASDANFTKSVGTVKNYKCPSLETDLFYYADSKSALPEEEALLNDTIQFYDMQTYVGQELTLKTYIYEYESDTLVGSATKKFTPTQTDGEVSASVTLDLTEYAGKTLYCVEEIYFADTKIAEHHAKADTRQQVTVTKLSTVALSMDGTHIIKAGDFVAFDDTLTYEGLVAGTEYRVDTSVMAYDADGGAEFVGMMTSYFTPESSSGTTTISYMIPSAEAGYTYAVDEHILIKSSNLPVANHSGEDDVEQQLFCVAASTTAIGEDTENHIIYAGESQTIIDTVAYSKMYPGTEFTVKGELYDAETGESLGITAEATGTAGTTAGTIDVIFTFDASDYEGKTLVVFEELYIKDANDNEILVAEHKDLTDTEQQINVPSVGTTLLSEQTSDHVAATETQTTLIDYVSYENLIVGETYIIEGTLMDKETETAMVDDAGLPITASTTFTATEASGIAEVTFTIDSSLLAGKKTVAFEELSYETLSGDFVLVGEHKSIEDENQTCSFADIQTKAWDYELGADISVAREDTKIVDEVTYVGLLPGVEYTMKAELVDEDGNSIGVTGETTFTPDAESGSVEVYLTFDSSSYQNRVLTVYESLYMGSNLIAVEHDKDNTEQQIHFPEVHTSAIDKHTDSHTTAPDKDASIEDAVEYKGLIAGRTYTIVGTLMNTTTGEPILIDGTPVTASVNFVPDQPDGKQVLTFNFDATSIAGEKVTVFEHFYYDGHLVAQHADLNDEEQMLIIPGLKTTAYTTTGERQLSSTDTEITINDIVNYWNLEPLNPNTTYKLVAQLADATTGELITKTVTKTVQNQDGTVSEVTVAEPYSSSITFMPTESSGQISITITATVPREVAGVVVYERLYELRPEEVTDANGNTYTTTVEVLVGVHEDPTDTDQTLLRGPNTGDAGYILYIFTGLISAIGIALSLMMGGKRKEALAEAGTSNGSINKGGLFKKLFARTLGAHRRRPKDRN